MGDGFYSSHGPREKIRQDFSEEWAKTLKLEPSQAMLLNPIVDDYLRSCDAANQAMMKDVQAITQSQVDRVAAQVAAQKRIATELSLTDEQKTALSDWTTTYSYWEAPTETATEQNPE